MIGLGRFGATVMEELLARGDEDTAEALRRAGADVVIRPLHAAAGPLLERLHASD